MSEDLNYAGGQTRFMSSSLKINAPLSDVKGRKSQVVAKTLYIYKSPIETLCSKFTQKRQLKPTFLPPSCYYFPIDCTAVASGIIWKRTNG